jgi:hypothetical protein
VRRESREDGTLAFKADSPVGKAIGVEPILGHGTGVNQFRIP